MNEHAGENEDAKRDETVGGNRSRRFLGHCRTVGWNGAAMLAPRHRQRAHVSVKLRDALFALLLVLMAERREFGEVLDLLLDHLALAGEERGDGAAETRVGDPVGAVDRHRQVAALQFVRPLRAGLDPLQAALDGELDRPVIAALEMQEAVFAVRPPVAAVDRVAAENVEGAGDVVGARAAP